MPHLQTLGETFLWTGAARGDIGPNRGNCLSRWSKLDMSLLPPHLRPKLNDKVKDYLQSMDLDVHEGRALFHILDNGDGEATGLATVLGKRLVNISNTLIVTSVQFVVLY